MDAMPLIVTGFGPIDAPHRDLARCVADLVAAVRARDAAEVRGRACLLAEKLAEHFSEEEALMRQSGWSLLGRHADAHGRLLSSVREFERRITFQGVSHSLSNWGQNHLPELIRHHCIVSDFGFAKFAMGLAADPSARLGLAGARSGFARATRLPRRSGWALRRRSRS
jgi:hemerythrin-like metal-binding protein